MRGVDEPPAEPISSFVLDLAEVATQLDGVDLSDWFNPFLLGFARETIRAGGRAVVARQRDRIVGLGLTDPVERMASVFARSRPVVETLAGEPSEAAVYSEVDLGRAREVYGIHVARLAAEPLHRFRHPVRLLAPSDLPRAAALLEEVYGSSAERWLAIASEEGERGLGAEVDGSLAGVAWVLVVGPHARLHGLTVRPGFRRLGIGTDLAFARLTYAWQAGARLALSEISERNGPSRAIAERAGMRATGRLFLYGRSPSRPLGGSIGPFAGPAPTSS
jgi:RimJ/RimL family protein N-acetyltransferase